MIVSFKEETIDNLHNKTWRYVTLKSGEKFFVKHKNNVYECEVLDEDRIFNVYWRSETWCAKFTTYIKCLIGNEEKYLRFDITSRNDRVSVELGITEGIDTMYKVSNCTAYKTLEDLFSSRTMGIPYESRHYVICDNADYVDEHLQYYFIKNGNVYMEKRFVDTFKFNDHTQMFYPTNGNGTPLDESEWYLDKDEAIHDMLATLNIVTNNTTAKSEVSKVEQKKEKLLEWCRRQEISIAELRELIG